ncbi:MAG: hypothetical protein PSX37_04660 [bacterium]|nr:hypothetical protein [bacterium]
MTTTANSNSDPKPDQASQMSADEAAIQSDATVPPAKPGTALSFFDRIEASMARLSTRSPFWNRVCSLIWLPYAFRSGIRMKKIDPDTFTAELPFRRFNRNWYNAMAGAALLANSEIAGGMYIFGITGGDYTLVCKELSYKFLRPCFGPALYKITAKDDIAALLKTGKEFNATVDIEVVQQPVLPAALGKRQKKDSVLARLAARERRVGACTATFHLTPTTHQKAKRGDTRKVGN